jgi:hypothetical protein
MATVLLFLEDNELRALHDIEFSLDYPTQAARKINNAPPETGNSSTNRLSDASAWAYL